MEKLNRYREALEKLKCNDNYRSLPESNSENLLDLCSNDYLGLGKDEQLYTDFLSDIEIDRYRFGACSSRLLSRNSAECIKLEELIAESYRSEACLLFNSGYHANIGILSSIASKNDLIIADKLVHASIIDGAKLSLATVIRFRHSDYLHLEELLKKNRTTYENVFIVNESIFSMDGDVADLKKLVELKQNYGCLLYIDEAHAIGVRGENGLGCVEASRVINEVDFVVGTFGKAIASIGAFVVCSELFKQHLVNHSRTFIFTTALPPINLAWTKYIFNKLPELNKEREKLKTISMQFAKTLNLESQSHIVPLVVGTNKDAVAASLKLKQNGFRVLPIRHPTVPKGTAKLRFSLNAGMNINQLMSIGNILKVNAERTVNANQYE